MSILKRLNINDVIEMNRTKFMSFQVPKISRHKLSGTWHPSGAAFWLVSRVSMKPPGGGILPGMLL